MCGLVGVFGASNWLTTKLFKHLLFVDQIRGIDSTGVFVLKESYKWAIGKDLGVPANLMSTPWWQDTLVNGANTSNNLLLMGHNRAKTLGDISVENAHPFRHGNIVLAHNGTLKSVDSIKIGDEKFETDSEQICYSISQKGIEWVWERLQGAAALTFYDFKSRKLYFIRNSERPLFYTERALGHGIFWASEDWMLTGLCRKNDLDLKDGKVWEIKPNWLFEFSYSKKKRLITTKQKELKAAPRPTQVAQLPAPQRLPAVNPYYNGARNRGIRLSSPRQNMRTNTTTTSKPACGDHSPHTCSEEQELTIEKVGYLKMYKPKLEKDFDSMHLLCMVCNEPLVGDMTASVMLDPDTAVCWQCFTDAYNLVAPCVTVH